MFKALSSNLYQNLIHFLWLISTNTTIMTWIYSVSHGLKRMNTWFPACSTIGEGAGALLRQKVWLIDTDRFLRVVALYHFQLQFSAFWQLLKCDKPPPSCSCHDGQEPILFPSLPCYDGVCPQNCEPKQAFSFWSCFCELFYHSDQECSLVSHLLFTHSFVNRLS